MEFMAKIDIDSRSDGVQLVAASAKPLLISTNTDSAHPAPDQPDMDRQGNQVLTLHFDSARDGIETLYHVQRILFDFPGSTPLHFVIRRDGQFVTKIITSHRYSVREAPELLEQLEPWL